MERDGRVSGNNYFANEINAVRARIAEQQRSTVGDACGARRADKMVVCLNSYRRRREREARLSWCSLYHHIHVFWTSAAAVSYTAHAMHAMSLSQRINKPTVLVCLYGLFSRLSVIQQFQTRTMKTTRFQIVCYMFLINAGSLQTANLSSFSVLNRATDPANVIIYQFKVKVTRSIYSSLRSGTCLYIQEQKPPKNFTLCIHFPGGTNRSQSSGTKCTVTNRRMAMRQPNLVEMLPRETPRVDNLYS